MRSIYTSFFRAGASDRLLLIVIVCTLLLLALALFLAIYTIRLRLANMRKAQRWERLEKRWEPVIEKVLAGERSPLAPWKRVKPRDRIYFVDFLLRYADGLPGEEQRLLVKTAGGFLTAVGRNIKKADPERYASSIHTLGLLGLDTFSGEIIAAMDDPSPLVNMVAARALLRNGRIDYVEAVLQRVNRFKDWSSGFLAAMLASAGPEASPLLREIFSDVARPVRLRAAVADALLELKDAAAEDTAVRVLQTETDRDLVAATLRLMKQIGRPKDVTIVRALCDSPDFVIRAHAVSALASLGTARDLQQLRRFFDDPSSWVAIHAAWALKGAGDAVLRDLVATQHPRAKLALQVLSEQPV